ncbi:unnamed protein product [Brachionus calyciflorus]|uniref:Nanos-type domain-containing protein n=1 Tax=Brachionus calyciflorus TaxID=104777 RepID=A0A813PF45_9BILA|nr:unnamed protein product [Brachionus calyciflorus]
MSSKTVLVAGLQQFVASINLNNYDSFYMNHNGSNYSTSNGSISPSSSIDSSNSGSAMNGFSTKSIGYQQSTVHQKIKVRPSEKIQVDVTRYIEKSARILDRNPNKIILCSFCKNNGEPEHIYRSHSIKDIRGRVTCPLLKEYQCPACGESGENAHTITYCKKIKAQKRTELLSTF